MDAFNAVSRWQKPFVSHESTELDSKVNTESVLCMPYIYSLSLFINTPEAEKCLQ